MQTAKPPEPLQPLPANATLAECVAKINEVIAEINHMWHDDNVTEPSETR